MEKLSDIIRENDTIKIYISPIKPKYYYIEDNKTISEEITEKKLEKVSAWALNIIEKIVGGEMTPTPGHPCQYCDYKEICEYRA